MKEKVLSDKKRGRPSKGNNYRQTFRLSNDDLDTMVKLGRDLDLMDRTGAVNYSEVLRFMLKHFKTYTDNAAEDKESVEGYIPECASFLSIDRTIWKDQNADAIMRDIHFTTYHFTDEQWKTVVYNRKLYHSAEDKAKVDAALNESMEHIQTCYNSLHKFLSDEKQDG